MNVIRRIALYFFSVYLIVLMVIPCSDVHAENSTTTEFQFHTANQDKENQHKDEVCTPFCVCGSCVAGVIINPVLEITFFSPRETSTELINFYSSLKSSFYGAIWQPPQLV